MVKKDSKIQVYLDDQTSEKIKKLAKSRSMSVSKYASRILENHANSGTDELFQIKIQAILAQILSSVYDYDVVKTNADEVKSLLKKIETKAREKFNQGVD